MNNQTLSTKLLAEAQQISNGINFVDVAVLDLLRSMKQEYCRIESERLGGAMVRLDEAADAIWDEAIRQSFERWLATRGEAPTVETEETCADAEVEDIAHPDLEVGNRVCLREAVEADHGSSPLQVFLFDEYDSDAPVDANCTLVDEKTGQWTVRGIGELLPVDNQDPLLHDNGRVEDKSDQIEYVTTSQHHGLTIARVLEPNGNLENPTLSTSFAGGYVWLAKGHGYSVREPGSVVLPNLARPGTLLFAAETQWVVLTSPSMHSAIRADSLDAALLAADVPADVAAALREAIAESDEPAEERAKRFEEIRVAQALAAGKSPY